MPGFCRFFAAAFILCVVSLPPAARAQDPSQAEATVGGTEMSASAGLTANLSHSLDHTILTRALASTGLDSTLAGPGPFTLFAPTDAAFAKIDKDKLAAMLAPENKTQLTQLLNYHIVPGHLTSADIETMAASGNGKAILSTVEGDTLTVEKKDGQWWLEDSSHNRAQIQQSDVLQSNGVLYVIDTVMRPKA